jgi:hypothetical protein
VSVSSRQPPSVHAALDLLERFRQGLVENSELGLEDLEL